MLDMQTKRIEWVDFFKAFAIITVVLGHSTGIFNVYIYQFHMAAFFFISGYTFNIKSKGVFELIFLRFCNIILPLLTIFFIFVIALALLNRFGFYNILFSGEANTTRFIITEFFLRENNYINLLGATWFLIVLYKATVLHKVIYKLIFSNNVIHGLLSLALFLVGFLLIRLKVTTYGLDLILVAQFYIYFGILFRQNNIFEKIPNKLLVYLALLAASCAVMAILNQTLGRGAISDYPSRNFSMPIINLIAALNGALFLYAISNLSLLLPNYVKKTLNIIGRDTLGILIFHFLGFKLAYLILAVFGIVDYSYLSNFTPTREIGAKFWYIIMPVSLAFSVLIWEILIITKVGQIFLGKHNNLYNKIYSYAGVHIDKIDNFFSKIFVCVAKPVSRKISNYMQIIQQYKFIVLVVVIIALLVIAPMLTTGVMQNDELQIRLARKLGIQELLDFALNLSVHLGRFLNVIYIPFTMLSFIKAYDYVFRSVQMIGLLLSFGLFSFFVYKLFANKRLSLFLFVSLFLFLPITFEHTLPSVFVLLCAMPPMILFVSLISYIDYLESGSRNRLLLLFSLITYLIALCGYEFIVFLSPLYVVVYVAKHLPKSMSFTTIVKSMLPFVFTAIFFLTLYFTARIFFPTKYIGNEIGFASIKSSFDIVATLFKSALPGYYLFNQKYQYLFNLYSSGGSVQVLTNIINAFDFTTLHSFTVSVKTITKYILDNLINLRVVLLALTSYIFYSYIIPNASSKKIVSKKIFPLVILTGILFMILPSIPNAIAKMYQGNVTQNFFTALPVSFVLYLASIFTITFIFWYIFQSITSKLLRYVLVTLIVFYMVPVQISNSIFANEQRQNYARLVTIEHLFATNVIKSFNGRVFFAPDLYKTKNLLVIHDGYWNKIAFLTGVNLEVKRDNFDKNDVVLRYIDDNYFMIVDSKDENNAIIILSKNNLDGKQIVLENNLVSAPLASKQQDNNFYMYYFKDINNQKGVAVKATDRNLLNKFDSSVGTTFDTASKMTGYSQDGWITVESILKIRSGKEGIIEISGYYPREITGKESFTVYINDIKKEKFTINSNDFIVRVDAPKDEAIIMKIVNDFSFISPPDVRELSFVAKDIKGL